MGPADFFRTLRRLTTSSDARTGSLALLDQIVVSGTGFLVSLLLARYWSVEEYGVYVLGFSVHLLLSGLQYIFITEPMMFLRPSLDRRRATAYVAGLSWIQLALIGICLAALGAGVLIMHALRADPSLMSALMVMAVALPFLQGKEYLRRVLFVRFAMGPALLSDGAYSAAVLGGLPLLIRLSALKASSVFWVLGGAALISCLISMYLLRELRSAKGDREAIRNALRMNWSFGRWQILGFAGSVGYLQAITFIVAALLGTAAAASIHATQTLLMPVQLLLVGVSNYASPRFAGMFARQGRRTLQSSVFKTTALLCGLAATYAGAMSLFPRTFLSLMYGEKYVAHATLVRLWAVVFFLLAVRRMSTIGLVAMRRPDITVKTGLAGGLISLALCYPLVSSVGVSGAVVARIAAEAAILAITVPCFLKKGIDKKPVVITGNWQ